MDWKFLCYFITIILYALALGVFTVSIGFHNYSVSRVTLEFIHIIVILCVHSLPVDKINASLAFGFNLNTYIIIAIEIDPI